MPTYNEAGNIPGTAELLMALEIPGLRLLVVDDASPDGTGRIAEERRLADTGRYFAAGTPRDERLAILRKYHVTWILTGRGDHGLSGGDPALRKVATGPSGQLLHRFVGRPPGPCRRVSGPR